MHHLQYIGTTCQIQFPFGSFDIMSNQKRLNLYSFGDKACKASQINRLYPPFFWNDAVVLHFVYLKIVSRFRIFIVEIPQKGIHASTLFEDNIFSILQKLSKIFSTLLVTKMLCSAFTFDFLSSIMLINNKQCGQLWARGAKPDNRTAVYEAAWQ